MGYVKQTSSQASKMHSQLSTPDDPLSKTHGAGLKANFVALHFIKKDVILLTSQGNSKMPTEGPRQHEKTETEETLVQKKKIKYSILEVSPTWI